MYDSLVRSVGGVELEPGYDPRGESAKYYDPDENIASFTEAR